MKRDCPINFLVFLFFFLFSNTQTALKDPSFFQNINNSNKKKQSHSYKTLRTGNNILQTTGILGGVGIIFAMIYVYKNPGEKAKITLISSEEKFKENMLLLGNEIEQRKSENLRKDDELLKKSQKISEVINAKIPELYNSKETNKQENMDLFQKINQPLQSLFDRINQGNIMDNPEEIAKLEREIKKKEIEESEKFIQNQTLKKNEREGKSKIYL